MIKMAFVRKNNPSSKAQVPIFHLHVATGKKPEAVKNVKRAAKIY